MPAVRRTRLRVPLIATIEALAVLVLLTPSMAMAISSETYVSFSGQFSGNAYGTSIAPAGDVNGDGIEDIIVGAPSYNGNQGRAYVYFMKPGLVSFQSLAPGMTLTGEAANNLFGISVASAGDWNGDGYDDVIVGASGYNGNQGRAYVFFGGISPNTVADATITGAAVGDQFGRSVASGNFIGDSQREVLIGAPGFNSSQGRAYYYLATGSTGFLELTFTGEAVGNFFGFSATSAGDVNGDGYDEIIVGGRNFNTSQGRAYVYFQGAAGDNVADLTLNGEAVNNLFGNTVSSAGDVNGDGYADMFVSAPGYNASQGRAYVFFGGPATDTVADLVLTGQAGLASLFGNAISSAGDLNRDGYADLIVGANGYNGSQGRVYVYLGGSVPDAIADVTLTGNFATENFGASVAPGGDADHDGFGNILIGAPGYNSNMGRMYDQRIYPYRILSPNGGEQWVGGQSASVHWLGHDPADLSISYDGGSSWSTLAASVGGVTDNQYTVAVPAIPSQSAMVRLSYAGQAVKVSTSDASDAVFRIVEAADPPLAANRLQLALAGEAVGNTFGTSVASAGDVNGDGYADCIVGAPTYNGNQGRAYVYYGGPGADLVPDLTLTGEAANNFFGVAVSSAGDFNADGYGDVLVGAQGYNSNSGRAYIYFGGPGADAVADRIFNSPDANVLFGSSVASAGDVNGDGYGDVVVGGNGDGAFISGVAYVFYGGPVTDSLVDDGLAGSVPGWHIGRSVSSAGDFNGDALGDYLIGADGYDGNRGLVYVMSGAPGGGGGGAIVTLTGEAANNFFGYSVSSAGDFNGDGLGDVIVGAYGYNGGVGRAYLYFGNRNAEGTPDLILSGNAIIDTLDVTEPTAFGISVSGGRDLNGDGYPDVIVGARGNGSYRGRAYVYYGGPGADAVADRVLTDDTPGNLFGTSVASAGDVNGDGYADVLVGATGYNSSRGRAYLYDWNRYFVTAPNGGETWNVGALKTISWLGAEPADVSLSVNGGAAYTLLRSRVGGAASNSISLVVPHQPGKFTKIRVSPSSPPIAGQDESDSLFTIQTSVALLALLAAPAPQGAPGAIITWSTDPGPADLSGYRLERASGGADWRTLVALTRETTYADPEAGPATRYRLFAVNGLGEELLLGETSFRPAAPLAAWPRPYRGGNLSISFATGSGLGGASAPAELALYDISGRLVRMIVRGTYPAGYQSVVWDGRDASGRRVASGIYLLRSSSAGEARSVKVVITR